MVEELDRVLGQKTPQRLRVKVITLASVQDDEFDHTCLLTSRDEATRFMLVEPSALPSQSTQWEFG